MAERALHDGVQRHEAYLFKQFKRFVSVCVAFPFVLLVARELRSHILNNLQQHHQQFHPLLTSMSLAESDISLTYGFRTS